MSINSLHYHNKKFKFRVHGNLIGSSKSKTGMKDIAGFPLSGCKCRGANLCSASGRESQPNAGTKFEMWKAPGVLWLWLCAYPLPTLSEFALTTETSLMERLMDTGVPVTRLLAQYRMYPDIASLVSKYFYSNQLMNSDSVLNRPQNNICQQI